MLQLESIVISLYALYYFQEYFQIYFDSKIAKGDLVSGYQLLNINSLLRYLDQTTKHIRRIADYTNRYYERKERKSVIFYPDLFVNFLNLRLQKFADQSYTIHRCVRPVMRTVIRKS